MIQGFNVAIQPPVGTAEETAMSELAAVPETESAAARSMAAAPNDAHFPADAPADCTPAQQAELRYQAVVDPLVDHALEHRQVEVLVDVLTWHLARIGYGFGTSAVADIVRRFGAHLGEISAREAAAREAKEAKKAGHAPH